MYLKRLEMVGFKSFAEKTRLEFEPGVTAIVGPNGCGKSNVVDALRWCLGEMSAKSLRSKVLVDVIFGGSANRTPSNLAEVSLTFDNTEKKLAIEYSEVTVTRRLFRSGESEYFLNKTQCRLRDIRELFLDTGVGEEGYSIMEQGRVEYILSARPEERRELFEEAAGISKYKARRDETLRKLDRTQLDLDRLSDVIAMSSDQMKKIEAAVRKARNYQKIRDDLKVLEINHALWETHQLDQQLESIQQALQVIDRDLQQKTTDAHQREAVLTDLRFQESKLSESLVELNKAISELDGTIGLKEQQKTTAKEREEEIRHRDMVLDAEISQGRSRQEELSHLSTDVRTGLEAEQQAAAAVTETLRQSEEVHNEKDRLLKEAEQKAKTAQDALWQKSHARTQLHNDIGAQKSSQARMDAQIGVQEKERQKIQEGRAQSEEALAKISTELSEGEQALREGDEQNSQKRIRLDELKTKIDNISQELDRVQNNVLRAQAQLDAQEEWESSDIYARGVQSVVTAAMPGIHGPLGKLIDVSPADEAMVRRTLGHHVNDLIAETLEQAQAAVNFLSEQGKGRARFIVLDRLPPLNSSAGANVGQRHVLDMVRTDDRFRPVLQFLLNGWISSGHSLYGQGILEGGMEDADTPAFDALRRENLQKEIDQNTTTLESLNQQKLTLSTEQQSLTESWETLRRELDSKRMRFQFLKEEKDKLQSRHQLFQQEETLVIQETERLSSEKSAAETKIQELESRLKELAEEENQLRAGWDGLQEDIQAKQADALAASSELAVIKERVHSHEEKKRWKEQQLADIETELKTLKENLESKSQERATSDQRIADQKKIQEDSHTQIEALLVDRKKTADDLEGLHTQKQQLTDRLSQTQTALLELREQTEEMKNQLQEKKLQQSHASFRRESMETHLKEKYDLSLAVARETQGLPEQAISQPELERLRKRVENMGPVNLAAPEEHAQLEERYSFLLKQQEDLLKAKEDLMKTIQKINVHTRANFKETFDQVRTNFQKIYAELFPGGEADVRLTDESDVLNAGVDIFAQPPGKKLQNITLLSGGEKALTAVALLFAFFMVRPAPFCVMDEVDAPLDEANVTRFVTMVNAFTRQSQFIMITHNKRSMETADTLYGVTMETLGVSRVLSARLKKDNPDQKTVRPEKVIAGEPEAEPVA